MIITCLKIYLYSLMVFLGFMTAVTALYYIHKSCCWIDSVRYRSLKEDFEDLKEDYRNVLKALPGGD